MWQACCKTGSAKVAVDTLAEADKYGLEQAGVVRAHRFNYLLTQLYKIGDAESEWLVGVANLFVSLA